MYMVTDSSGNCDDFDTLENALKFIEKGLILNMVQPELWVQVPLDISVKVAEQ